MCNLHSFLSLSPPQFIFFQQINGKCLSYFAVWPPVLTATTAHRRFVGILKKKRKKGARGLACRFTEPISSMKKKKKSQWCAVQMINYCLQHRNINCFRFSLTWCESLHLSQWSIHVFENSCFSLMAMNPPIQTVYCIYSLAHCNLKHWRGYQRVLNGPVTYTAGGERRPSVPFWFFFSKNCHHIFKKKCVPVPIFTFFHFSVHIEKKFVIEI